ncbi:hypothetical protein OIO90_006227, partial [Microbotryomycetes sp. JL221]
MDVAVGVGVVVAEAAEEAGAEEEEEDVGGADPAHRMQQAQRPAQEATQLIYRGNKDQQLLEPPQRSGQVFDRLELTETVNGSAPPSVGADTAPLSYTNEDFDEDDDEDDGPDEEEEYEDTVRDMLPYGLKPWNPEDWKEYYAIQDAFAAQDVEDEAQDAGYAADAAAR